MEQHSEEIGGTVPRVHPVTPGTIRPEPEPAVEARPSGGGRRRSSRRCRSRRRGARQRRNLELGRDHASELVHSDHASLPGSPLRRRRRLRAGSGVGFGIGFGGFGPVLHGEATVKGPNGYETIEVQTGTVTSVKDVSGSTWSLVVTSADKTALTYTVAREPRSTAERAGSLL